MSGVIASFAIVAFALSMLQLAFSTWRWTQVPSFRVLEASFVAAGPNPKMTSIRAYRMVVLATGGARTRRIVNWTIIAGDAYSAAMGGLNMLQPIDQVIPAHDVMKFTLEYQPGGGMVVGETQRVRALLILDLGRYQEIVRFELNRSGDSFHLDADRTPVFWDPRGIRRRLKYEVMKRLP